jgi:hypothetical protein
MQEKLSHACQLYAGRLNYFLFLDKNYASLAEKKLYL